jgi:hypothetical protein
MALNFLDELDITSTGDTVLEGFDKAQDNFEWLDNIFHGYVRRSKFRWKDADEIYLGSGVYHHEGTVNQLLYWNSELTFKFGSAGSNASSDDLTASALHYVYIDDSAVVTAGTNLLTETEFLNDTTGPTWSASKHGWYNGDDRCVFAVLTSGASAVLEFNHSGDYMVFAAGVQNLSSTDIDTTWTDVILSAPSFSTKVMITGALELVVTETSNTMMWRTNGQTDSTGHVLTHIIGISPEVSYGSVPVITDSAQTIEIKNSKSNEHNCEVTTDGWYFSEGI